MILGENIMSSIEHYFDRQNQSQHSRYADPHHAHQSHQHDGHANFDPIQILRRLMRHKTLLIVAGLALLALLGLSVAAVFYLLPMVWKMVGSVDITNWQSLLDQGLLLLQKVLATGKGA
jgi:hypothetical protein